MTTEPIIANCIECGVEGPLDKDNKCSICGEKDNN